MREVKPLPTSYIKQRACRLSLELVTRQKRHIIINYKDYHMMIWPSLFQHQKGLVGVRRYFQD